MIDWWIKAAASRKASLENHQKSGKVEAQTGGQSTHSNTHKGRLAHTHINTFTERQPGGMEEGRFRRHTHTHTESLKPHKRTPMLLSQPTHLCQHLLRLLCECLQVSFTCLPLCVWLWVCEWVWMRAPLVIHLCVVNHCEAKATFYLSEPNLDHMARPSDSNSLCSSPFCSQLSSFSFWS